MREECRRADIDARSVLLEIARLGDPHRMREAIAMVKGGSTREDLRDQKKGEPSGKGKGHFHFVYNPKDAPYKFAISFDKARVHKDELIGALRRSAASNSSPARSRSHARARRGVAVARGWVAARS